MKPYKGYVGVAKVDADAGVIRGHVVNSRDTITFQGETVRDAEREFHTSVDIYLEFCAERGRDPDREYSGTFVVRTKPAVHRGLAVEAARRGVSINALAESVLKQFAGGRDVKEAAPASMPLGEAAARFAAKAGPARVAASKATPAARRASGKGVAVKGKAKV